MGGLAYGQAGSLDPGFNSGSGTNGEVQAAVQQADGKTLIIGTFTSYDGTTRNRVARLEPDGTLDPSFDPAAGPAGGYVLAALEQSDGRILLAGEFTSYNGVPRNGIARLNADGSLDNSFDPGTGVAGSFPAGILAMALQPDGKIIVGGNFDEYNGTTLYNIARLNTDGSLDGSFDAVTNDYVRAIELQPDGKVLIGGDFTDAGGFSFWHIARLNTDGSADLTFNPEGGFGPDYEVNDIERQPDGKILIVGYFSEYNSVPRMRIARLLPNGNLDTTFDPGISADDSVEDVSLQPDGKIFISGNFGNYQGVTRNRLARLLPDGTLDTTFDPSGSGANGWILQATALPGGKVLICGSFNTYDGAPAGGIARLRTASVTDMAFDPGTGPNDEVLASLPVGPLGNKMVIAGRFTDYDGHPMNGIARINRDGSIDTTFHIGSGANGAVLAIDTLKCGSLLVAGEFTTFNDTVVNGLVQLNPDGSIDTTFQWTFDHEAYDLPDTAPVHVTSVTVPPPEWIIIPEPPVVVTITVPDPVAPPLEISGTLELTAELTYEFTPLSGGSPGDVFTDTELTPDAGVLVVGHQPAPDGGTGTNLELITWPPTTTFDPVQTTDANGNTSTIDNVTVNTGGFPWGDYVGAGNNLGPDTVPEWKILVAGDFVNAGGVARNGIAQLNKDGSLDLSFDPGTGPNGPIRAMAVRPDGRIMVGGEFTSFNGVTRSKIVMLKPDGSVDESFDPGTGMDDDVNTISMFGEPEEDGGGDDPGCNYAPAYASTPAMFVAGKFSEVDGRQQPHATVLDDSQPEDCAGEPGGNALPGSACDDGDAGTTNDVYTADCACAGTPVEQCTAVAPDCVLSDDAAYQTVIANDSWCCTTSWDSSCQSAFNAISGACNTPAHDECADAIVIGDGVHAFSTIGTTGASISGCGIGAYADIWYEYVASCNGTATVTTCDDADFDTTLSVFDACGGSELACNDDGDGCLDGTSTLNFTVSAGTSYWVRVAGYSGATGTGNITVGCSAGPEAPANDACANATVIGNGVHPFSTVGATGPDVTLSPNCVFLEDPSNLDVWFEYVAECTGEATASTCDD
ncbi:MAG: delta-60 repeat domain-containing protein, partial [Flavobacteriales bacterium]|nr:delta-60 repeat domain-containing protein [Flavobacteriales bacterium]